MKGVRRRDEPPPDRFPFAVPAAGGRLVGRPFDEPPDEPGCLDDPPALPFDARFGSVTRPLVGRGLGTPAPFALALLALFDEPAFAGLFVVPFVPVLPGGALAPLEPSPALSPSPSAVAPLPYLPTP